MATRMQQRRGTAAQWTAANPVLAAGEIGFETDTNKFKMGNGTSTWTALQYFANAAELAAIIDGAPDLLNTLGELAEALGDNPDFLTLYATNERLDTMALNGANQAAAAILAHKNTTMDIHGIADTQLLATTANVATAKSEVLTAIATAKSEALTDASVDAASQISNSVAALTKASVGLESVDNTSDASKPVSAAQEYAIAEAKTEAITEAGSAADDKISAHNLDTLSVHGIADTSVLVTQTDLANAISGAVVDQSTLAGVGIEWNDATEAFDVDSTHITTATQTELDLKAPLANPTFTGTVAGVTKSHVGLANVDNTADADKPVSTATQTALDAKASLAGATFTGDVTVETNFTVDGNFTVSGTTTTVNTTNFTTSDPLIYLGEGNTANLVDVGFVGSYNDGTYAHQGLVKDSSDGKWKLFKGITDEPTTTVNFAQGSLDDLKVGALEATTVTPSSGIVFSDGTQTKVGVPSITAFATEITSSATLAAGEADKFVPLNGAVTITLPASGYSTGQSIDFWQSTGTGAQFASTNGVVGTPGYKFRTTNSVVTAMKTASGWLIFGDLSA